MPSTISSSAKRHEKGYHGNASEGITASNPYEASGVKRADGCSAGAGWPSE
jgi:hypothetical protein